MSSAVETSRPAPVSYPRGAILASAKGWPMLENRTPYSLEAGNALGEMSPPLAAC